MEVGVFTSDSDTLPLTILIKPTAVGLINIVAIKPTGKKNEGKFNIPGWNSVVKSKHQIKEGSLQATGKLQ